MFNQDGLGLITHMQVRGDPTHTLTLRRAYCAQMTKRFRALKGVIRKSLIENDALGLKSKPNNQSSLTTNAPPGGKDAEQIKGQFSPIPARRFDFARSSDKIEGFMEWLDQQQKQGILEVTQQQQIGRAIENQWQNTYIRSAYQKGILRARQEMQNAGYAVPDIEDVGGINAVFNQKFHADRVGSLFTRAFNELKGITDAMDQQISRTLAEGISRGDGPEAMARAINDRVDKVGLSRARTMARTETIRAHHSATIQEYRNAGVEGVKVKAEWSTAGDSRVCFPKFMEVSTPNGDKKINDVKIGDLVSTPNGDRKVLNKSERIHKGCMTSLYFDKEGFLFSTSDHPIWSETRKDWIEAQALYPNERCQLIGDKTIEIYSVVNSKLVDPLIVQDLTIEKAHCFYVNNLLVHNCELCKPLEGHVFDLDTIEGMIPRHPNCFIDMQTPIYTSEGWKKIGDIQVGDQVLTHKKRFRQVYALPRTQVKGPNVVRFKIDKYKTLTMTEDHPVLVTMEGSNFSRWKKARSLRDSDLIVLLADYCPECGDKIPFFRKYCSRSCASRSIANEQWTDPEHRRIVSEKNQIAMRQQYDLGLRDKDKITRAANEKTRELVQNGVHPFQFESNREKGRHLNNTPEQRARSSERMSKNNPMKDPEVAARAVANAQEFFRQNPHLHPNVLMAQKGRRTGPEQQMKDLLDKNGVEYREQYPILSPNGGRGQGSHYYIDFAMPDLGIAIEVDGLYWHTSPEKDAQRDKDLEGQGWTVLHFTDVQLNKEFEQVEDEVCRVAGNHSGNYTTIGWPVTDIEKFTVQATKTLYNLSVEEDESYIAKGVIVHNCRCCALPVDVTETEEEVGEEAIKEVEPRTKSVDELRQDYDQAKTDYDQALKDNPVGELVERRGLAGAELEKFLARENSDLLEKYREMKYREYVVADQLPEDELLDWKRQRLDNALNIQLGQVSNKELAGIKQNMNDGIAPWCPYDVLDEMVGSGYEVIIKTKKAIKGRASFRSGDTNGRIMLTKNHPFRTFGHEWGHAVDDFFSREMPYTAQGFRTTGGMWVDNKYVTRQDGENFQSWYKGHTSGKIGTYMNGDGQYHKNNWIDSYEGRIYAGDQGVGPEWWAMNIERYSEYRKIARKSDNSYNVRLREKQGVVDKLEETLEERRSERQEMVDRLQSGELDAEEEKLLRNRINVFDKKIETFENQLERSRQEYENLQQMGKEAYAAEVSKWTKVQQQYPNLTEFIENKFGGRIARPIE